MVLLSVLPELTGLIGGVCALRAQLMASDRNLSQYKIGRGDISLIGRLSRRHRTVSSPPGGLPTVAEVPPAALPPARPTDWRQRFIQVRCSICGQLSSAQGAVVAAHAL